MDAVAVSLRFLVAPGHETDRPQVAFDAHTERTYDCRITASGLGNTPGTFTKKRRKAPSLRAEI